MKLTKTDKMILKKASVIMEKLAAYQGLVWSLTSPDNTVDYLKMKLAGHDREEFIVVYLNSQNEVMATESLFQGTINGAPVYPRVVVKAALHHNAAAVVLAHNHPSGLAAPSMADKKITERLQAALALVDIRVLDHVILAGADHYSFASHGML